MGTVIHIQALCAQKGLITVPIQPLCKNSSSLVQCDVMQSPVISGNNSSDKLRQMSKTLYLV
jgi:hypothetical protein